MALNLSTLTSPATSGDVLAEALTTADFLEPCPVLRNLSRGSNKGGDAKQDVALNQPRALPLIKNPAGNLGGYLYIPNVSGNYATGPSVTIGSNQTWQGEVDMVVTQWGGYIMPMGGGGWNSGFGLIFASNGTVRLFSKGSGVTAAPSGVTFGTPFNAKYGFDGTNLYVDINDTRVYTTTAPSQTASITHPLHLAQNNNLTHVGNYAIQKAKLTVNSSVVFDCDFNGSTSIRHGDTKFKAAVGGFVSIASPELLINGNFDTDTAWTKTGGWLIADGVATLASVSGNSDLVSTVIPVTAGKTYKVVVNVIATSGSFRLYDTAGVVSYYLSVGENVYSRVATGSTYQVTPLSLGSGTATIDSISVTEVSPDAKRDPITIIKKPVLRFDGTNDCFQGLFNQTIDGGYMFAAFSVLGDGGEDTSRIFSVNNTGGSDGDSQSAIFSLRNNTNPNNLFSYSAQWISGHPQMFDDDNGDILHESLIKNGTQKSLVNNAGVTNDSNATTISAEEFNIVSNATGFSNSAIDLEFLALFDATITDAQAEDVRNYINNRNNVFDLKDGFGYYFFDAQKAPAVPITSGSSSWNGRIVGSDNGDTNRYLTQGTSNDAPVGNGYTVTFADNSDHLDIPQVTQAGWQVVGTSLGTFAYRVNNTAVTELNLLGNAGSHRSVGDSYGMLLLPDSATGADIEQARKFLIDRGAADSVVFSGYGSVWNNRTDIVEFRHSSFEDATNLVKAFKGQTALNLFSVIQAPNCSNFSQAWQSCTALTSFPAGAKLGTAASNVNFTSAWQSSGLTSFPSDIDLSKGTTFNNTWRQSGLTSFSTPLPAASDVSAAWYQLYSLTDFSVNSLPEVKFAVAAWYASQITSFTTGLPKVKSLVNAWNSCSSLTDFSADVFADWNPSSISSGIFNQAWLNCSLTAQSVENILTSIDASGKYATSTGASGGTALGDAGIDIDYNVATGSLSAATNTAIDSLSGKGWEVFINGVLVIPNILDLAPAAAYSLRSFDASADPNVVNVRRSSDGATSDFKASEVSDGTLVAFVGAGNDGHVTAWYDQGGTNHATQTVASSQPKLVDAGTLVTEGGLAALDFDGAGDYLNTLQNNPFSFTGPVSMSCAYYKDATAYKAYETLLSAGSTGNAGTNVGRSLALGFGNHGYISPSPAYATDTWGPDGVRSNTAVSTNQRAIVTYNLSNFSTHRTAGNSEIRANGSALPVSAYNTDDPTGLNATPMRIGVFDPILNASFFSGTIQEIVVFNTDQATQSTGIENNINDTYTIY